MRNTLFCGSFYRFGPACCAAALVLLSSCASLIFERAGVVPGSTVVLGGSWGARYSWYSMDWPGVAPSYGPEATLHYQYGINERWVVTGHASVNWNRWLDQRERWLFPEFKDIWKPCEFKDAAIEVGAKFRPWPDRGHAFKFALGYGSLIDLGYLYDPDDSWTVGCGIGLRGVNAGVSYHIPISRHVEGHVGLAVNLPPAISFGFGIGYRSKARE